MSEPLDTAVSDGGLNSADTRDWEAHRSALRWPVILLFGLPMVILCAGILLMVVSWNMTHKPSSTAGSTQGSAPVTAAPAALAAPVDKDAEIAALRNQIALLQTQSPGTAPTPAYTADPAALAALSARLDRVEANQRAFAHAAMVANAAEALEVTARSDAPFTSQLNAVEPGLDDPSVLAPLRPYADKGVATEVDLAVNFPRFAAAANIAGRNDSGDNSLLTKALHALGSFISIRRIDNTDGQGTQAILRRAENSLNLGDLNAAVGYLDTLKPAPHKAIEPWLADARARLLVDDTTHRVAASALARLAQVNSQPALATPAQPGGAL